MTTRPMQATLAFMPQGTINPSQQSEPSEWDQAAPRGMADRVLRAAALAWTLGVIEILVFGLMSICALVLSRASDEDWLRLTEANGISASMAEEFRSGLLPAAMMLVVLGIVPAICLLGLGWGVKQRHATATYIAQLLTLTQTLVFGVLAVAEMVAAFLNSNPSRVTIIVVTMGSLVALMAYTCKVLGDARREIALEPTEDSNAGETPR